ncbi:recombinase family protein [Clostridium botulinum]|uniref:recombinase family protein n=1 Tax=Clostridium botulinum TaxID=1491 RepID=UPI00325FD2FE
MQRGEEHSEKDLFKRAVERIKDVSGKVYKSITTNLNKLGYKTKKGNNFSVGSIKDILTNPVYIGKIRYNLRQN